MFFFFVKLGSPMHKMLEAVCFGLLNICCTLPFCSFLTQGSHIQHNSSICVEMDLFNSIRVKETRSTCCVMVREKFATHAWSVNKGLVSILTDVGALFDTFYMSSTHEVMWEILILQVQWSVSTCNCLNPQSAVDVLEHKQSRCAGCVNTQLEFCDQVTWLSILGHEN